VTPDELKEADERRRADLRAVLSTPGGRRLVLRLVETVSGAYSSSYAQDTHATAYREGQRSVGLALAEECKDVAPESWVKALAEAYQESIERRRLTDARLRDS